MSRALEMVAGIHRRAPFGVAVTMDHLSLSVLDALRVLDARVTFFLDHFDADIVDRLRRAGHGMGWRTEAAHDELVLLEGHIVRLHRPALPPTSMYDAILLRRRRLDSWLWSVDEHEIDRVRDRDVVRVTDDVERAIGIIRERHLELLAL